MPYRHRVGIHQIRTDPPVATIYINFFFCGNMGVVFACKSIHVKDDLFRATQLDHRLAERHVADKSIMNVFILFLSIPLLKLFSRVEFSATFFLPVPVTVWRPFLMWKFGMEKRSSTDEMYFLFSVVSSCKKCPHVQ